MKTTRRPGETIDPGEPSSFQSPPGYDIGGEAPSDRNAKREPLPAEHPGAQDPSQFQHPRGQIAGDDLAKGDSLQGMTDNVLGTFTRKDMMDGDGHMSLNDNPSLASLNPSTVDDAERAPRAGFLDRVKGSER